MCQRIPNLMTLKAVVTKCIKSIQFNIPHVILKYEYKYIQLKKQCIGNPSD